MKMTYTLTLIVAVLASVALRGAFSQATPTEGSASPPCGYQGPPSSARQCKLPLPTDARPVEGRPYRAGSEDEPVQCVEQQYRWTDRRGCKQYCRVSTACEAT